MVKRFTSQEVEDYGKTNSNLSVGEIASQSAVFPSSPKPEHKTEGFGDFIAELNLKKISKECRERGYHRIEREPSPDDLGDLTHCYDCSMPVWHRNRDINNINYRVEPL